MAPKVSVVVPAYNVERYVARAVRSALAQTLADVEVIVVDDGSTDSTAAAALAAGDDRVRVVAHGANRGPGAARNTGIEHARGEWVGVLDADDWFGPRRLARLLEAAEATGADLVADDLYLIADGASVPYARQLRSGGVRARAPYPIDLVPFVDSLLRGKRPMYSLLQPLIRREALLRTGLRYDEGIRLGEDIAFGIDALLAGLRFVVLPEPHYYYRQARPGALTAIDRGPFLQHFVALHDELAGTRPLPPEARRRFLRFRAQYAELYEVWQLGQLARERGPLRALLHLAGRPRLAAALVGYLPEKLRYLYRMRYGRVAAAGEPAPRGTLEGVPA
ncbi:MAG TPA: glycosyltransferase family 2 protein [Rubricoccaceae bacterium]|nr:glycosyltransferase family 2 protein [Rubricoccaceae bacterium]